ncbi:hypothetical protein ACFUJR_27865 [Streptomyces sp. NPDC057271]|uniref:hypothetical protein n=1 Tax=unclassified Streptomyces TaxID=2593676 RepID=UPI003624D831
MSIPTPGDVARIHLSRSLIAPAPHDPATDEPYRALWERGVIGSQLHRNAKLVGLTLASHADWATGHILDDQQPRLAGLVTEAALNQGQTLVSLKALESRGWIRRTTRRERWDTAAVELTIPGALMPRLIKTRPARPA